MELEDAIADSDNTISTVPTVPPFPRTYNPLFYASPDRIIDGLFLGGFNAARNRDVLLELGIKYILTVADDLGPPQFPNDFTYTTVSVMDMASVNLSQHFETCFSAIHEGREKGGVLVHCLAGMSRSVTVVVAYLMKSEKMTLAKALAHVQKCRPIAQPNKGFMRQLQEFEKSLKNDGSEKKTGLARWLSESSA